MRIIFISDTHNYHKKVKIPDGDILIHTGDATSIGRIHEVESFGKWISNLPHKYKLFTPGNHDITAESHPDQFPLWLGFDNYGNNGCYFLHNQSVEIEGLKIYMSGCTPTFSYGWAFNVDRGEKIKKVWSSIPNDTNILCTHGPAYGILDFSKYDQRSVGCQDLIERIENLDNLIIHSFGHLHESYGTERNKEKLHVNASICTLEYNPTNKPIIVDVFKDEKEWVTEVIEELTF